jgi:hypothetical protein
MKGVLYILIISGLFIIHCEKGTNYCELKGAICDTTGIFNKEKEKDIPDCKFNDPLVELEWLKELSDTCVSDNICQTLIIYSLYKDKPVFYTSWIGALCDPPFEVILLDCMGDTIKEYKLEDKQTFDQEVEFIDILYTCPVI